MAESYIFFKQDIKRVLEIYKKIYDKLLNKNCIIEQEGEEIFKCNNMKFYKISDKWCVGNNMEGNTYAIERLFDLSGNEEIIYIYFDEDDLEGELVIIQNGKIVRKLYDYFSTPELNENIGKIEYENDKKLANWVDIASYSEYLFENL